MHEGLKWAQAKDKTSNKKKNVVCSEWAKENHPTNNKLCGWLQGKNILQQRMYRLL